MIRCGFCDHATEPGICSNCERDPALPWLQRDQEPPSATDGDAGGRPRLEPGQIRAKLRIATKELGGAPTQAQLAEHLQVDVKTVARWQKLSGK